MVDDVAGWFLESGLTLLSVNLRAMAAVVLGIAARLRGVGTSAGVVAAAVNVKFPDVIRLLGVT